MDAHAAEWGFTRKPSETIRAYAARLAAQTETEIPAIKAADGYRRYAQVRYHAHGELPSERQALEQRLNEFLKA